MVGDDRTRLENHVGADFRVSPDVGIGGDDTVGQTCAFAHAHAFPEHGVLHVGPGADPTAGAQHGARADAAPRPISTPSPTTAGPVIRSVEPPTADSSHAPS